jgi:acetyl-CoA C-acetyltransferase
MADAYIVGAVRTPVGRRGGGLSGVHPADLAALVIRELVARTGVDPAAVEDVLLGCVTQMGPQSTNIARIAALSAGLPESVPGTTIDRQCGSAQQAVHFAAQAVRSGDQDLVIAGGVEVMSVAPLGSAATLGMEAGHGHPRGGAGWRERYGDQEISQFRGAELIAKHWALTREQLELFAVESHRRALAAIDDGRFEDEIVPVGEVRTDEGPRRGSTVETLAALKTLRPDGVLTAALSSPISDGAAGVLVASESAVREHGLTPLAIVRSMVVVGSDPVMMLTGPIPATERIVKRSGIALDDIGMFEVNEAFAPVVLAWQAETGVSAERTNRSGGALALGHPVGATGARLMTTMIHAMRRDGCRYGMQTMCEGGGMANATILERA